MRCFGRVILANTMPTCRDLLFNFPLDRETPETAHHESLDHDPGDALNAHDEDGLGALLGGGAAAVSDSVLGLDAEEEAAGEAEDVVDAGHPIVLHLQGRQVVFLEVTVSEGDQPPARKRSDTIFLARRDFLAKEGRTKSPRSPARTRRSSG